ncbi:MAG: R3H domain-containing nucleic acid-binding protein [Cyanobacteria bacterium P01_C01_bin.72]
MKNQLSSGQEWLGQLLTLMGVAAVVETEGFETVSADSNSSWLSIGGNDFTAAQKQQLIGNKGESIDAIQYLANTILNLDAEQDAHNSFVVEIDGYRVRRNQELAALTQEAIAKVQSTGEAVEIPGLSSAERKQIHSLLEGTDGLRSESRGQEPNRNLIVLPE